MCTFNDYIKITFLILIWLASLLIGSGIEHIYKTTEIIKCITIFIFLFFAIPKQKGYLKIEKNKMISLLLMILSFFLSALINIEYSSFFNYIWVFFLVMVICNLNYTEKNLIISGNIICVLGIYVLYDFTNEGVFAGWNSNSVAITGLYSYLMFMIPNFFDKKNKIKIYVYLVSMIYLYLLYNTDSRSSILCMSLMLISYLYRYKMFNLKNSTIIFILLFPMILSIVVVLISNSGLYNVLDIWSRNTFDKPIFNGRNEIWQYGMNSFFQNPLLGIGYINTGYWHNSAMACLVSYGFLGYTSWIIFFYHLLKCDNRGNFNYNEFPIKVAFMLIYLQQSVELGLFSQKPNLIPYFLLGLLLSKKRMNRRVKRGKNQIVNNCSSI